MNAAGGIFALLIGAAYTGLGVITVTELVKDRRTRGYSHFGAAFAVMAFTCGPHHLVHGTHILVEGHAADPLVTASIALGLPAGLIFISLRVWTAFGGRGDVFIRETPPWLALVPCVAAYVAGALMVAAIAREQGLPAASGIPSLVLAANYFVVGWFMTRTQCRRRGSTGGWSLSGVSLAMVFPTCALMHAMLAVTTPADVHLFTIDLVGVPASFYYLWATRRLYRASLVDWNRRPIVGRGQRARRPSPWRAPAAAG